MHHDDGTHTNASEEIGEGLLTLKSIASVNALDIGDGLVMLDTGGAFDRQTVHDAVRGWRPEAPVRAAVCSHHHVDHVLGTALFDAEAADKGWERPGVYAPEELPAHFRRYEQTGGWNTVINRRKVLHPGDLFIWALPNAGNPQKVQRYLSDWGTALRQMAALRPEILLAGHGLPIFGADCIVAALTDTAELLESVESHTLAIMNQGKNLDTCLHEVTVPAHLADKPDLQAVYDHPQFLPENAEVWSVRADVYSPTPPSTRRRWRATCCVMLRLQANRAHAASPATTEPDSTFVLHSG